MSAEVGSASSSPTSSGGLRRGVDIGWCGAVRCGTVRYGAVRYKADGKVTSSVTSSPM